MPFSPNYAPTTVHTRLGPDFYDAVRPAVFPKHVLRHRDRVWDAKVGLGDLTDKEWIDHFGRFKPLPGALEMPLALRYHGHQFRVYNPDIGDGRGFLFAQLRDDAGRLLDLGTKGSGQTPWSRDGDGRLTLKGGVREVLATSMLEALGVDTSKSFSLIETGEELWRGDEPSPTRSAVLVRLSHSHIRIGSFQRLRFLDEVANISKLLSHCVEHYLPEARREDEAERAVAFLEAVGRRVARTGAAWMMAGFVHGVLNTDNINITGESFDYGPWRFLPVLDPKFTAAYFDQTGLYAYGRQPDTLLWNMTRLAECLLPLVAQERLEEALRGFEPVFRAEFDAAMRRRLGLASAGSEADARLVGAVWKFLIDSQMPFEQFFFDWFGGPASEARAAAGPEAERYASEAFAPVRQAFSPYGPDLRIAPDRPYFGGAAPCTMLVDEVEAIWDRIAAHDDWTALEAKLAAIAGMKEAYTATSA
ncbi:MAG: YdiU family protein [Rhizobiaceae bacterium]|nr:YdiU family protein [Rhizobiaceae bacterium]MCV0407384.1 YdiU family protein [Rhizobiaceae bacterium]